ncbi:MAG: hypothetical protein ACRDY0_00465 [Acidimicrobiales bacterium]
MPGFVVPPHLQLREVLDLPGCRAAAAEGALGVYLVVPLPGAGDPGWVCAPVTERALDCVRAQRTSPWSAVNHSATGTVDVWQVAADGTIGESVMLCADLRRCQRFSEGALVAA